MTVNIALTGKLRSGKDTLAAYLTEKYGYTRFAFGDELKRYANELFDVEPGAKPRELLQWFGQAMRERAPDVWVRKCFDKIAMYEIDAIRHEEPLIRAVITDLRQPSEFGGLRNHPRQRFGGRPY
jgi:dephospho-CoA kinase